MKIIGVIPARYKSTRLEGKPLADIHGRPMIWWVYEQVKKAKRLDEVYVATDDDRIANVCREYGMHVSMTRDNHPDHISRVQEVSDNVKADYYICINGDEPLIESNLIDAVIPNTISENEYFGGAMRDMTDPVEVMDSGNIKLGITDNDTCIYMSRTPIPYPKGTLMFEYKKYLGIECFNKKALDFFVDTPMGRLERIEDIDHLRFLENGITLKFTLLNSNSISVDTAKDLEKVRHIIAQKIEK